MASETEALRVALERLPRVRLAHLPTPLEPLPRLSAALGDVELWMKRDDLTGLAFGGNKARQLELTLGEAVARGADTVVQGADAQSNHCRQAAAAAARLGLACHLVLQRPEGGHAGATPQGNLLLDHVLGATLHWTDATLGEAMEAEKRRLAAELEGRGAHPYVIGGPRGKLLGAAAYAGAVLELREQCEAAGLSPRYGEGPGPDALYACTTGSTHAGLLLGVRASGLESQVQAVAPIRWDYDVPASVAGIANGLAEELGLAARVDPAGVRHSEDFVGTGYGVPTREARAAIELVARLEGILLDPVYTGKAMAGLIDHVRRGRVRPGARVVFLHTGGVPLLFAHAEELRGC